MVTIGEALKEFRKERGFTQKELSQDICSQSVLSRIENDEEIPNILVISQLSQRLGISVNQLIGDLLPEELLLRKYFNKMFMYLRQQGYLEIEGILAFLEARKTIYLDKDLQLLYYFKGICSYYIDNDPKKALEKIKKGLSVFFTHKSQGYFDQKILLLCFAGKMQQILGNFSEAERLYSESFQLYKTMMADYSERLELVNIFTNYGNFLFDKKNLDKAEKVIDAGLTWSKNQHSYYQLAEMLTLKIKILDTRGLTKESEYFKKILANMN
ncbi:helix-turn-helix domain-containing protein [Enterococcus sp. ALS3]|uniref:Helix-turn-helix domain-containing protein n=1 Tax=Enterococcus alishanensis TaxID=1303817 RepID=A0ABS6TB07_9ENTE|nr:helix-turn-helix transcriptional regulator [Enterococcus alishanensis]MBV7390080.1 helix-turn-helix domain-containing protein [Enterococcus alishanensis]